MVMSGKFQWLIPVALIAMIGAVIVGAKRPDRREVPTTAVAERANYAAPEVSIMAQKMAPIGVLVESPEKEKPRRKRRRSHRKSKPKVEKAAPVVTEEVDSDMGVMAADEVDQGPKKKAEPPKEWENWAEPTEGDQG